MNHVGPKTYLRSTGLTRLENVKPGHFVFFVYHTFEVPGPNFSSLV